MKHHDKPKSESDKKNTDIPATQSPFTLSNLKQEKEKNWAGGVPAVIKSLQNLSKEKTLTRGGKALFKMNQFDGFDCPSCGWPDPDDERSPIAEYCENGAKALAEEATTKRITADFFKKNSVCDLSLLTDYEIGHLGRLSEPMYLPENGTHYQPISWDEAFEKIAFHLNKLESPDNAAFYTSGRTSNEASFAYQLFVREFGTNNFPDCSNMCHETSGFALRSVLGVGKGTVKLKEFYDTDIIFIIGQNPGTNSPRMLNALAKGKKNGAKIIAVNPLPEAGLMGFRDPQKVSGILGITAELADLYLPVKINGDLALLKAIEKFLLEFEEEDPGKVFDYEFIKSKTTGFDQFLDQLKKLDVNEIVEKSGVSFDDLKKAAEMIRFKKRIIICWGMGVTQQHNGVDICREIINLLLLKGSIGKPGGGPSPVRGHSNVQGNRTMLIDNNPTQDQLDKIQEVFGFNPPRESGYDVVETIKAMNEGKVKVFFGMGGNFLSAAPDTTFVANGIRKLDLSVSVSTKLNRSHLIHGKEALILPTISRSEKDIVNGEWQYVSTENSMGVVEWSRGMLEPVSSKLINETHIVCRMAKATLGDRSVVDWDRYLKSYDAVREDIEKCIPGFDNYNVRVKQKGGFYLPNAARDGKFKSGASDDKAQFSVVDIPDNTLAEDEYLMATTRTHDQFNTTIYGLDDRYRGIYNERRVILMNINDIKKAGLKEGDKVDLYNFDDGKERIAPLFIVVKYPVPEKNTITYFPETNVLVSINNVVKESNMPASKFVRIKIRPHDDKVYERIEMIKNNSLE
ncbi:FdhF/YdeP family oxidoreductase [Marinigracilibium pacificum]|uniref:FdhF/YdeP family oxidoreductase n=1 Tax=Marinigracilibium pacificum TaxID=2729599 RepID=A0A848J3P7_9BACT|nr:FdhF/YdeP family oxidoreductase [Marinigracilibium pacificum]NMM50351.1 FdhF/YdeP family oxidoreductase [Marinigracilibium pacificum]